MNFFFGIREETLWITITNFVSRLTIGSLCDRDESKTILLLVKKCKMRDEESESIRGNTLR